MRKIIVGEQGQEATENDLGRTAIELLMGDGPHQTGIGRTPVIRRQNARSNPCDQGRELRADGGEMGFGFAEHGHPIRIDTLPAISPTSATGHMIRQSFAGVTPPPIRPAATEVSCGEITKASVPF